MTEAKYPEHHPETIDELSWTDVEQQLNSCSQLRKSEFSRFAFSHNGNVIEFFYQGQYLTLGTQELPLIEQLCGGNALDVGAILELSSSSDARNLLTTLFRQQLIYTEE